MDRIPVLVKSVFSAPVPEYALLTTFALSAQTKVSLTEESLWGTISEHVFKVRKHVYAVGFFKDARFDELFCNDVSCKGRLNDIGPVETIHTVCSNYRSLFLDHLVTFNQCISTLVSLTFQEIVLLLGKIISKEIN